MIRRTLLGLVPVALVGTLLVWGCSADPKAGGSSQKICSAGQFGYCLCKNGQDGTRKCKSDETGFEKCQMGGTEECPGGEVPLDDAGNPIPDEDGGLPDGLSNRGCPGRSISVAGGQPLTISGNTTGAPSQHGGATPGACDKASNNAEEIYELTPSEDGALNVTMTPIGFDGVLYARAEVSLVDGTKGDCATGKQIACGNSSNASGVAETMRFNVVGGDKIWIFADGANGGAGQYKLDIALTPNAFCGNGKVDTGEACDDKNKIDGDGCSPGCQPAGNPNGSDTCPGMPITVWGTSIVNARGQTTTGFGTALSRKAGTCAGGTSTSTGANAPNRVYAVTAKRTGTMTVTTSNSNYDHQLYVRTNCTDQNSEVTCASAVTGSGGETMSFAVQDGTTYYVVVDGLVSAAGNYDIAFSIN
jgi:cysteine-rich repeat protein